MICWQGLIEGTAAAPRSISIEVRRLAFFYDSRSRRIRKTVEKRVSSSDPWVLQFDTRFVYDGWNMVGEAEYHTTAAAAPPVYATGGTAQPYWRRTYVWGQDLSGSLQGAGGVGGLLMLTRHERGSKPRRTCWATWDLNGNVTGLVENSLKAVYVYDPLGKALRVSEPEEDMNPFRFSKKYTDAETGLVYYGYRYYQTEAGRWISRDPIGEEGGGNLYGIIGNDPVNRPDVLGLSTYDEFAAAVDAAATPRDLFNAFTKAGDNNYLLTCHCGILDVRHLALAIEGVTQGPIEMGKRLPPMTPEDYMNRAFDKEWGLHPWGQSTPQQRADRMSNVDPKDQGATTKDHPSEALGALAGSGGKWKEDVKKIVNSCSVVPQKINDAFIAKYGSLSHYITAAPRNPFSAPQLIDDMLRSLGECCPERKPGETPQDYFNRSGLRYDLSPSRRINKNNWPSGPGTINWNR